MRLDDERLAASWRARPTADPSAADCPDSEAIWHAVVLESEAPERLHVIEHLVSCPSCAETWRLAAEFHGPAEGTVSCMRPQRRRWTQLAALAATLAVLAVTWQFLRDVPNSSLTRTATAEIRSALPEQAVLPRERFLLRWTEGPRGTVYEVEVATADLRLLAHPMALTAAEYLVPAEALADVSSGSTIAWRVHATLPDGRVASSVTFLASVR